MTPEMEINHQVNRSAATSLLKEKSRNMTIVMIKR